jgi:zinc protease
VLFKKILVVAFSLLLFPVVHAGANITESSWPVVSSDLFPSPRITFGRLDNGLRYALLPNRTPPGQVSLRLLVLAGSLNEQDNELGYAHFVEHMAFRSTRNFPGDAKVIFLQGLGAAFGPDTNAETDFTHTLYKLDLPDNSAEKIQNGLRVLRDFADGMIFDATETDHERGVVQSEAAVRHGANENRDLAHSALLYEGTLVPQRSPIGTEASIQKATANGLRSFYESWYRPENMIIVISGDIDLKTFVPTLQASFASLRARTTLRPPPPLGKLVIPDKMAAKFISEPRNGVQVELGTVRQQARPPDTMANSIKNMQLGLANKMLIRRLDRIVHQTQNPIAAFSIEETYPFEQFRQQSITTVGNSDKWPTVLATAEKELRRALERGFEVSELETVKADMRNLCQDAAKMLVTTPTTILANNLVGQIENQRVCILPEELPPLILTQLDSLTLESCRRALQEAWGDSPRYIFVTASGNLISPTPKQIRTKYQESQATALAAGSGSALQANKFAYDDFGLPGAVVKKEHVADLDIWQVRFGNDVRLNLKRTHFHQGVVSLSVRIGSGRLSEPANQPGVGFSAPIVIGLGKHTDDEVMQIFKGANFNLNTTSAEDAFVFSGSGSTKDLRLALDYSTAFVTDATFRPEARNRLDGFRNDLCSSLEQSVDGVTKREIIQFLAGNPRIGFPSRQLIQAYSIEDMAAWLRPLLATGEIEVALVGDIDIDQTIAEVARTFGTLPARKPKPDLHGQLKLAFPTPPQNRTYAYWVSAKGLPVTLAYYWPVHDPVTIAQRLRLQIVAMVLNDRLRAKIRVANGETYTPEAQFDWDDIHLGLARLGCRIAVKATRAPQIGGEVRKVALNLGQQGASVEEFSRAKAQLLPAVQQWQRNEDYWLTTVLADAQEHPWRLDDARQIVRESEAATLTEINSLAAKYLTEENLFQFTIRPEYRRP